MIESGLRRKVAGLLREAGFFVQTIETETGPGVPDMWWVKDGKSGWIELKLVQNIPVRPTTAVFKSMNHPLSTEQVNWISLCLTFGGRADILVGYKTEYFLIPGKQVEQVNGFTESALRNYKVSRNDIPLTLIKD